MLKMNNNVYSKIFLNNKKYTTVILVQWRNYERTGFTYVKGPQRAIILKYL